MYSQYRGYIFCVPTDSVVAVQFPGETVNKHVSGWNPGTGNGTLSAAAVNLVNSMVTNADMKERLIRLLIAIEASIQYDENLRTSKTTQDTILRVFIAPEFYFRPPMTSMDKGGAYTLDEFASLVGALGRYFRDYSSLYPKKKPLKNWAFLCGSCVYYAFPGDYGKKIRNSMFVYCIEAEKAYGRIVSKAFTARDDGIPKPLAFNMIFQKEFASENRVELLNHFFPGFGFAVEICLEHRAGLVKNCKPCLLPTAKISLQVISAAAMLVIANNSLENIEVLRCDGERYENSSGMFTAAKIKDKKNIGTYKCWKVKEITSPWSDLNQDTGYLSRLFPNMSTTVKCLDDQGTLTDLRQYYNPVVCVVMEG